MTGEETSAFLDGVTERLMADAPDDLKLEVLENEPLREALLAFKHVAAVGLSGSAVFDAPRSLEQDLRAIKTTAVAASRHPYTVEKLLARALREVLARAGGGSSAA